MRKILFLVCVLGIPCVASARTDKTVWANLSTLQAGQKIEVIDINSKVHSGTFVSFSDATISYKEAAGEQTIPKQSVRTVLLRKNKHRLRNALVGAGVGAGIGALIGVAVNHNGKDPSFIPEAAPAILGVIGLAAGAVIGVALPTDERIYKVKSH